MIQFGDEVVLYGGRERVTSIRVERNQCTNHKFGVFRHNDIAGVYARAMCDSSDSKRFAGVEYVAAC